jgi:hypothetical protein
MSLEEQVKAIAQYAARDRWGHPEDGPEGMALGGSFKIHRIEQTGPDEWIAYYDEPDTHCEEWVYVERRGNILYAGNWDDKSFEVSIL